MGSTLIKRSASFLFESAFSCVQGADHLTVTWKVDEGIYQHVDVREEGKENAFSLGRSLWIDNEVRYFGWLLQGRNVLSGALMLWCPSGPYSFDSVNPPDNTLSNLPIGSIHWVELSTQQSRP